MLSLKGIRFDIGMSENKLKVQSCSRISFNRLKRRVYNGEGEQNFKKWKAEDDDKRWHRYASSSFRYSALLQGSLTHSF